MRCTLAATMAYSTSGNCRNKNSLWNHGIPQAVFRWGKVERFLLEKKLN